MFVTLMTIEGCHTICLPETVNGQYWFKTTDSRGRHQKLFSIEAIDSAWCVCSNEEAVILDEHNKSIQKCEIKEFCFYKIGLLKQNQFAFLFTEPNSSENICYSKFVIKNEEAKILIGKSEKCNIRYNNMMVSSSHAELTYSGGVFTLTDTDSTNGTFVNNRRVKKQTLMLGDVVYIIGLKIIIGNGMIAVNNPGNAITVDGNIFAPYKPDTSKAVPEKRREDVIFSRSPQFKTKLLPCRLEVDMPPQKQNGEEVPVMLALGSSMTMGLASMTTALFAVNNAMANGNVSAAVPSIVMSASMLCGSIVWPIATRKHNIKTKNKKEQKRLGLYRKYIDDLALELDTSLFNQAKTLNTNYISLNECCNRVVSCDRQLWERSANDEEFLTLRLGTGVQDMIGEIVLPQEKISLVDDPLIDEMRRLLAKPRALNDVPITLSFFTHYLTGIIGEREARHDMIKNLIMQIVTLYGYDYVKIGLLMSEEDSEEFSFVRSLPHFWNDNRSFRYIGENDNEIKELSIALEAEFDSNAVSRPEKLISRLPYYILISTDSKLNNSVGILKKVLDESGNRGFSLIFSANELREVPKECSRVIYADRNEAYVLEKENLQEKTSLFSMEKETQYNLGDISCLLSNIRLETGNMQGNIPSVVDFLDMYGVRKVEHLNIVEKWKNNDPTRSLEAPIGKNEHGNLFMLDLHQNIHGPHGLVAGMTGSGKSEFIITYILSMAVNYHPNEVSFVLIDYKGGGMAKTFEKLPHTVGIITNLDGAGVNRSLVSIKSELSRRQAEFLKLSEKVGESNIDIYKYQKLYRSKIADKPMPHLFIISDEFAELKQQRPEFMEQLVSIARIGRSLGVHLILATQKPDGVVDDQIWSNSKFKVCLKVQTKDDSQRMINRPDAASLVQTGRFFLQVGYNELFEMGQSAWAGAPYIEDEKKVSSQSNNITVIDNIGRVVTSRELIKEKDGEKIKFKKQVDVITQYLSDIAKSENIKVQMLWQQPIDEKIYSSDLEEKYGYEEKPYQLEPLLGEIDDPGNQRRLLLTVPISRLGNLIVYGAVGSGKAMVLNELIHSMITHHNSAELNMYIMDFDAETMISFAKAPQVGGVVLIDEEDKIDKLFRMLLIEVESRKKRYVDYGGDFDSYNGKAEHKDPAIVLAINNVTAFEESYEDKLNALIRIARNGPKYGIFTIVTRTGSFGARYKLISCFPQKLVLQCSDESEYANVLNKTGGMVPSAYEGRGLLKSEGEVLEFQTACCTDAANPFDYFVDMCTEMSKTSTTPKARAIPILPKQLTERFLRECSEVNKNDLRVPIGLYEKSAAPYMYDFGKDYISFVLSSFGNHVELADNMLSFLKEKTADVMLFDTKSSFTKHKDAKHYAASNEDMNALVVELFELTVARNNEYKTLIENGQPAKSYDELVVVIDDLAGLFSKITLDGGDKLRNVLLFGKREYNMHFIILERVTNLSEYISDDWYKEHISERNAIWLGSGLNHQYRVQCTNVNNDAIPEDFGFVIKNSRGESVKFPVYEAAEEGESGNE